MREWKGEVNFTGPGAESLAAVTAARKVSNSCSFSEALVPESCLHVPIVASPKELRNWPTSQLEDKLHEDRKRVYSCRDPQSQHRARAQYVFVN